MNYIKPYIFLFFSILLLGCSDNDDPVVAEANGKKLYTSQIEAVTPKGLSPQDSIDFVQHAIKDWVIEQLLLQEAEKELTFKEKDFSKELKAYRERLLLNAYLEKITADTNLFPVSNAELHAFMKNYGLHYTIDKEIIKLNYVKLSKGSKLIPKIKDILFDEEKRQVQKADIERLCGDSIEYFIDDERWLYLEDIEFEFPIQLTEKEDICEECHHLETEDGDYHYLIVFLDYRKRQTAAESANNDYENAKNLLRQQKKNAYIKQKAETLYENSSF